MKELIKNCWKPFVTGFAAGAVTGVAGYFGGTKLAKFIKKRKEAKKPATTKPEENNNYEPNDISNKNDDLLKEDPKEDDDSVKPEMPTSEEVADQILATIDAMKYRTPAPEEESDAEKDDIVEISEDEFYTTNGAKKLFFTFYDKDRLITDDMDELVPDVESYIGKDILKDFTFGTRQVIHIHNFNKRVVIELGRVPEGYVDTHGGEDIDGD